MYLPHLSPKPQQAAAASSPEQRAAARLARELQLYTKLTRGDIVQGDLMPPLQPLHLNSLPEYVLAAESHSLCWPPCACTFA